MKTGFIYDPAFLEHDTGPGHPECSQRLESTIAHLETQSWFGSLHQVRARKIDPESLQVVHAVDYIQRAEKTCDAGHPFLDSMDVSVCKSSFDISLLAAGASFALADEIAGGKIDNGFVLARPPGHHAEKTEAMGFCLFNNVALVTRYLQQKYGIDKVCILDWDVHHGNGTQHIFEEDPSVLYISTHEYPYYPGTGAYSETGVGPGKGATLNCPMAAGAGDHEYERAFIEKILPAIEQFSPGIILISAGFDAHVDDPLGHVCLSTEFYRWMTDRMVEQADRHCEGRLLSILEGGYNLSALPLSVAQHLKGLMAL